MSKLLVVCIVFLAACFLPTSAALSETDEAVVKLTLFSVLDDTGHFNYIKPAIDDDDNVYIWYIPKNTDSESTMTALSEIIGAYVGMCRSHPELSDLLIMIGTEDNENGKLYCDRSWITTGTMSNEDAALLVLKVLGTFEET